MCRHVFHNALKTFFFFAVVFILFSSVSAEQVGANSENITKILKLLEKQFSGVKSISADFVQTKKMSLFDRDIKLKGHLTITFPHYFKWEVFEPVKTTVTADGDSIEIWDAETGKTQKTSIKNNPVVKSVWAQIDAWFMGRYAELAAKYTIQTVADDKGTKELPVLRFTPKSAKFAKVMKSVTVTFAPPDKNTAGRYYLKKIVLTEQSGDYTLIEFLNTRIKIVK